MRIIINREESQEKQTLGNMEVVEEDNGEAIFKCFTMELPWENNERNISCIPTGEYNISKRRSDKYGDHFILHDVPDRDYILIHVGNYYSDLRGCIAPGLTTLRINNDEFEDVGYSGDTMAVLNTIMPNESKIEIK